MRRIAFLEVLRHRRNRKRYTKHIYSSFAHRAGQLLSAMVGLVVIHTAAMMYFENMTFSDGCL